MQPRERADLREPEVARARDAEELAQRRLHRPDRMHHVEIGVGDDVGGDGERQEQRPFEDARPGKRYMVTSHAVPTPIAATTAPTPRSSSTVVRMA